MKTPTAASLLQKLIVFAKWIIFHAFSRNEQVFASFGRKNDKNAETW